MQQHLDELVRTYAKAFHLPSVSVGVYSKGQQWFSAAGRRRGGAVDEYTVYPIASATKAFLATMVLQLQEEGLLDLDDPVVRHLPGFALYTAERTEALTIRDALCHRCGLPRHNVSLMTNQQSSLSDMVYKLRYLEPAWPARQRFYYQNHMFGAVTLLVEQVCDLPWGEVVRQRVFDPLGMTHSYTRSLAYEGVEENYARPRAGIGAVTVPIKTMLCDSTGGAGAISSNAHDMLQWVTANLHQGSYGGGSVCGDGGADGAGGAGGHAEGGRLFSGDSARELHECQMPVRDGEMFSYQLPEVTSSSYGLGWFVETYRGEKMVWHGGTVLGFKSHVGFLPEHDFAFCILTNRNDTFGANALGNALCDSALGLPPVDWSQRFLAIARQASQKAKAAYHATIEKPLTKQEMPKGAAGIYHHAAYGSMRIEERGRGLVAHVAGMKIPIIPACNELALDVKMMRQAFACRFELDEAGRPLAFLARLEDQLENYIRFDRV